MDNYDDIQAGDMDNIGFMHLTEGQPKVQREAAEELYNLLNLAFTVRFKERGELANANTEMMKNLPRRIHFFAGVLNDSPVENYDIAAVCGISRKIAVTMRRIDETWDDEKRELFGKKVKTAIIGVLETIEEFDEKAHE
jgi:hypothetical protein